MKKCNKKGFSLVEILAVIIILAILALITIPFVANLIKQARINAAVVSAYGYVEAANNEIVSKHTKGEDVAETQYSIKDYNIEGDAISVKYEGTGPEKGWFNVLRVKVSDGVFCINGYEIVYEDGRATYDPDGGNCSKIEPPALCTYKTAVDAMIQNGLETNKYSEMTEFYIESADDMYCLADLVNNGKDSFQNKTVVVRKDIDMTKTNKYSGQAFNPIGSESRQFKGTFKGDYNNASSSETHMYTISNLTINKGSSSNIGMFGYLSSGAKVGEFNLHKANITGGQYTGGVVGNNPSGRVYSMNITEITVTGKNSYIGGIAGENSGTIEEIAIDGSITATGNGCVGGAVGENYGTIRNVLVNTNVTGSWTVGGFVGYSRGTLRGVVEGGTITASSNGGKSFGGSGSGLDALVYTSNTVTITRGNTSSVSDGNGYNKNYHYISMYDDVLDTYYGGASGDYYFDFDNNDVLVLKKVNANSFTTQISGSGTESDPYILSTEQDFKDAALLANGGYYFRLGSNIDPSTFTHFYPLGTTNVYFNGVLDGNNKTISNMQINGGRYTGLVSHLNGGTIKDFNIEDSLVANRYHSDGRTGSLVGVTSSTSYIKNIEINNITVSGRLNTGGVVGYLQSGGSVGEININTISVTGIQYTGGVVGYNTGGRIYSMNVDGISITGRESYIGGIAGEQSSGTIEEIVVRGNIDATGYGCVGGAVGENYGTIRNVLVNTNVTGSWTVGGFVGYSRGTLRGVVEGGTITASSNGGKSFGGSGSGLDALVYTSNTVTITRGNTSSVSDGNGYNKNYHYISMYDDVLDTYYGGASGDYYFDFDNNDVLVLKKVNANSFTTQISGSGTESDPYILSTEQDFKDAALLANGGYYFRLGSNIDPSTFTHFYPLGTTNVYFNGVLDGNNKTISNMQINGGRYTGLVSHLNGGTIKDFNIEDSLVANRYHSDGRTGSLVGVTSSTSYIKNIEINNITVSGRLNTGGVVGYLQSGGSVGEININTISVTGIQYTGGVVGYNTGGRIYSMNVDGISITGRESYIGGIAGEQSSGTIEEIVVRGNIDATGYGCVGGAVGENYGTIRNVLVNTNVTGSWTVGGFVGYSRGTLRGVVEGGTITASSNGGKSFGGSGSGLDALVYTSNTVTITRGNTSSVSDGNGYNKNYHYISMYDDVLDTYYGGASGDYYFDFDNNDVLVLKKVNANSFTTQISGSGTESDPYILSTEQDFKDAALLANGGYYFRLGSNIDPSTFTHFYPLGTTNVYFNGVLDGNNKTISNMQINGGRYTGLVSHLNGGTIKDFNIEDSLVANRYHSDGRTGSLVGVTSSTSYIKNIEINNITVSGRLNTGGVVGYLQSGGSVGEININTISVTGIQYTGGVVGYNTGGRIYSMNVDGISITGRESYIGGIAGEQSSGTIEEIVVRGNIDATGYGCVGGAVGENYGTIRNVLVNTNVTGSWTVGGFVGYSRGTLRGVVEGGTITASSNGGKSFGGSGSGLNALVYTSNTVTITRGNTSSVSDGTNYSAQNANLEYYGSILFDTNKPLLEHYGTGDVNNTGWWFSYDSNGKIVVIRVGSTPATPNPPVCTGNCSNPDTYPLENTTVTGTCPSGDITPPTCTFNYFVAVTNGIRASFSCTDETSVPTVASMFNSTTKATYTFDQITDPSRGGTVKTGTVSGNTRNITSTWTTTTVPSNPPQRGLCYYYQMAAKDECGNEGNYTTSYCYYGFSNPQ